MGGATTALLPFPARAGSRNMVFQVRDLLVAVAGGR
jgi:hypothetical protein